jgi:hypothetical protein
MLSLVPLQKGGMEKGKNIRIYKSLIEALNGDARVLKIPII